MTLPEYTQCVLNPFDMPACGYPDTFNRPTLKVKLTETYLVSSDSTGMIARFASPSLTRSWYTNTTTAGLFVSSSYTAHPDYASVSAQALWARTVCFGVQVDYIGATATAAGTLAVITDPSVEYWLGNTPESCMDDGVSGPAVDGRRIAVVPSMPPRYESDASAVYMSPTFDYVYILATGLPVSTACLRITVTRHVEMLPTKANTVGRGSATHTTASSAALAALSGVEVVQAPVKTWKQELATQSRAAAGALFNAAKPMLKFAGETALSAGLAALAL